MKGIELLESLQELDEDLLLESEENPRRSRNLLRWGALAACAALLAGGLYLGLGRDLTRTAAPSGTAVPSEPAAPSGTAVPAEGPGSGAEVPPADRPAGMPGEAGPPGRDAAPRPDHLAWIDLEEVPGAAGGVVMVGEPLTPEQVSACAPGVRLEWMQEFTGSAEYYLHDGSGGLAFAELRLVNESEQGENRMYRILLRSADDPNALTRLPETELRRPMMDGHAYAAFRCRYAEQGEERVYLAAEFVCGEVAYALSVDAPLDRELYAGKDLSDLMLCYFRTETQPDLSLFRFGGGDGGTGENP
jgi:hypothetical protein